MAVSATGMQDFSALNGLSGTYGTAYGQNAYSNYGTSLFNTNSYMGYSGYSVPFMGTYGYNQDPTAVEGQLEDNYSIYTTQQGYQNQQNVEQLDWAQLSANITTLLSQGRTDDAMTEYKKLEASLAAAPQYANYNESQIKAIAQQVYAQSTGITLTDAIDSSCSDSFVQGLKQGIPIFGQLFAQGNSKEDALSEVTGVEKSAGAAFAEGAGATLSSAAAGAGIGVCFGGPVGAAIGGVIGGVVGLATSLFKQD